MPLHDFILPKPHTNSTVFDFLVIFCSFYVYSLVPGVWHQCWYFGAQLLSLQPCCLRLAHYITVTHSRLASNAVVSSLFDRISTCWIVHPLPDALSGTWSFNYPIIVLILLLLLIALRSLSLSSELIFLQFDLKISSIISITCSYLLFTIIEAKHSIAAS